MVNTKPILSPYQTHTLPFYFLKTSYNIVLVSATKSSKRSLSIRFSHQKPVGFGSREDELTADAKKFGTREVLTPFFWDVIPHTLGDLFQTPKND
jgi:hypothetical protein